MTGVVTWAGITAALGSIAALVTSVATLIYTLRSDRHVGEVKVTTDEIHHKVNGGHDRLVRINRALARELLTHGMNFPPDVDERDVS